MRRAVILAVLFAVASLVLFNGCQGGAAISAINQQLQDVLTKLDQIQSKNQALEEKVNALEKTINDLKASHPELFEKPAETTGETKAETKTTKTTKGTTKKTGKGKTVKSRKH